MVIDPKSVIDLTKPEIYSEVEGIKSSVYAAKAALACKEKFQAIIGSGNILCKFVDLAALMLLANKFASRGIFITDETKDEAYVKVLETGDQSLIDDLERYIDLKNDVKKLDIDHAEYKKIISKLRALPEQNDVAAVIAIAGAYISR